MRAEVMRSTHLKSLETASIDIPREAVASDERPDAKLLSVGRCHRLIAQIQMATPSERMGQRQVKCDQAVLMGRKKIKGSF